MNVPAGITISRDGQQFGPYTLEQVNTYLQAGNLLPTDLAWNPETSAWLAVSTFPGVQLDGPLAPPPPPLRHPRNVFVLVLMGIIWWLVMTFFTFFLLCFLAGMVAGVLHPDNAQASGRAAGQMIGVYFGLPLLLLSLGLSIWLTIIGKLPGTRK